MSHAILRMFQGAIAFIGPETEVRRADLLVNKWDAIHTKVQTIFDDGLTYCNHCMSLYIQHDASCWRDMEDLFRRTKLQGKTAKTIRKKADYFTKHFWKVLHRHPDLAKIERENDFKNGTPWDEQFRVDSSLCIWWMNYYFATHDAELNVPPFPLYTVEEDHAKILANAKKLERRMKGNRKEPKFTIKASEVKLEVQARDDCWIKFEWDDLSNACELMGLFETSGWTARDGTHYDHTKAPRKKLNKMFPHAEIECMDTPSNLYGDTNNWFYVYFHWKPEHFSWAQVRKAERAMKELVVPRLGTFRPADKPKKYQVVTLKF